MTTTIIPTFAEANYDQVVNLDGTDYTLNFLYSDREQCYYLSVADAAGDIANGIKVVANWPLLQRFADPRLPPGEVVCFANTTVADPAPSFGQIGVDLPFTMYYITRDELAALGL